eukprot:709181-Lingulodinium_polyedra.AAC.1
MRSRGEAVQLVQLRASTRAMWSPGLSVWRPRASNTARLNSGRVVPAFSQSTRARKSGRNS